MKNIYSLILVLGTTVNFCSAKLSIDHIEEAIEQSTLSRVKALINKSERDEMTDQARKKMLGSLYDSAVDVTERRQHDLSIVGDGRDIGQMLGGFGLCVISLACLGIGWLEESPPAQITGAVLGPIGSYLVFRGISCSYQKGEIAQAKLVEKFIKGKINELDIDEQ